MQICQDWTADARSASWSFAKHSYNGLVLLFLVSFVLVPALLAWREGWTLFFNLPRHLRVLWMHVQRLTCRGLTKPRSTKWLALDRVSLSEVHYQMLRPHLCTGPEYLGEPEQWKADWSPIWKKDVHSRGTTSGTVNMMETRGDMVQKMILQPPSFVWKEPTLAKPPGELSLTSNTIRGNGFGNEISFEMCSIGYIWPSSLNVLCAFYWDLRCFIHITWLIFTKTIVKTFKTFKKYMANIDSLHTPWYNPFSL